VIFVLLVPAFAATVNVAPGEDWCAAANAAAPGDEILLADGDYAGPCTLSVGGEEGAPITVRGAVRHELPRIVYTGTSSNVIDVTASWITVQGLAFGPTEADIDAIKVKSGDHVSIVDNTFTGVGGIGVSANSVDTVGLTIEGNTFQDMAATAIYLGCHEGAGSCVATDVVVRGNLIDGVVSSAVGYGMELKKDSWGLLADNVVVDTQGPGIEVFGGEDHAYRVTVQGNLVVRSMNNGSIEVGGSNVRVVNNIVVGGGDGAISVYAYWDAVYDVVVAGNTVVDEGAGGLRVSDEATDIRVVDNAGYSPSGAPFSLGAAAAEANVTCATPAECWVDAASWDFGAVADGPLVGAGVGEVTLSEDFCGIDRVEPPTVGALEAASQPGALGIVMKSTFACAAPEDDEDDGPYWPDEGEGGQALGCLGCASGASPAANLGVAVLAAAALLARRR